MMWSRTRKLCILVPLLIVWILFQLSYYNRRLTKQHKISNVKSFDDARKSIIHTNRDWSPPDIVNTNYDYDFPIFLEGKEKSVADKFWFMNNGNVRPEQFKIDVKSKLWPEQCSEDRIIEQLMYIPSNYSNGWSFSSITKIDIASLRENKLKKVLLIGDFDRMDYPPGRKIFFHDKCPVNTCTLARTTEEARNADVVIFKGHYVEGIDLFVRRQPHHVWILYLLESPANFKELGKANNLINWTASYRHDSDIVTPYGKFVPYSKMSSYIPGDLKLSPRSVNYAANKTKKVAWFVSNCNAKNDRLQYAESLSQHIDVDIFGECGTKKCPQFLHSQCLKMLDTDYKFYLSFENSNCKEYITEKFFKIGLGLNILPIVMGPPREDYLRVAPPHSFIHVNEFVSPKELADYLHLLDSNDTLYNQYFEWKSSGELINARFWCRLCAMLHSPLNPKSYGDIQKWWSGPGICEI